MPIILKDRVKESTTTTGTSDFLLGGAVLGFMPFSIIGNNNFTYYCCVDSATGDWEVGFGQYTTTGGGTIVRDTVLDNSANSTSKISFSAGPKELFITYPAKKAIYEEESGNVLIDGGPITVVGNGVTSYTSFTAVLGEMYGNVDSYAQFYAQNYSDGANASGDFVVYRNDAVSDTAKFVDMGINSSNYSSVYYPIFTAGSAYLFNDGGELFVGSATDDVVFFAGGTDTTDEAGRINKTTKAWNLGSDLAVGGTLGVTGAATFGSTVTLNANPATALEAATKAYVDNAVSTGIHVHPACQYEADTNLSATYTQGGTLHTVTTITSGTTLTLSATHGLGVGDEVWFYSTAGNGLLANTAYFVYSVPAANQITLSDTYEGPQHTGLTNGTGLSYAFRADSGVGAYLTATSNGVLNLQGSNVVVGNRVLVYQQTTGYQNGIYEVTNTGSPSTPWVLTRSADEDYYAPSTPLGLGAGDYTYVESNGEAYVLNTLGSIIIGYTSITFELFSAPPQYNVVAPLNLTGNVLSLSGVVDATHGGTGQSTVTTGDLLYGSATDTWSKLAKGAAYRPLVMNGSGTNVEWNALALNQSGAVSGALPASNGGTGITAYNVGEMLFANTTSTLDVVTRNATTTKKFLSQTGTGTVGQAPVWAQPAATDITGLASSATTDTTNASNISSGTLGTARLSGSYTGVTGVGTLTAGTWNANAIGPTYGGTGIASYAIGDILYADTTTSLAKLADVAVGNALISGGVSSAPSWGKIGLTTHVSGTLPVSSGGTGATTLTANNVLLGNGTSAVQVVAPGTSGNLLTSNGTTWVSSPAPSGMVYPGTGIPNSTGSAWGTSYSTTGSGTVVALATSPTLVTPILGTPQSGNFSTGTFTWPTFNQNTTGTAAGLSGSQTANYVYAAPNGSAGTASFRALVPADIPTLNQNTTGNAATVSNITRTDSGSSDLNTLTTSGFYRINGSNANRPGDWGQLLTVYGGADTIGQLYFDYTNGNIISRAGNPSNVGGAGSWSAWRTNLNNNNYNNYAPTLTGTGASGTWGINVTGSAGSLTSATWQRITGNAVDYGSYGSIGISGVTNTYAGISFSSVSGTLMMNASATGFYYNNNAWRVYWDGSGNQQNTGNVVAGVSDGRLKFNVKEIEDPLEKIRLIRGVTHTWDQETCRALGYEPPETDVGVIAQEVQVVQPEVVTWAPFDRDPLVKGSKSGQNYLTVKYEKLVPLLIQTCKALDAKVLEQDTRIAKLEALVAELANK